MADSIDISDPQVFKATLISLFEQMQDQRTHLAETVRSANLAARPLFQLETQRLASKLGRDDPRVAAMQARADNRLDVADAMATELEIAAIRVPNVSAEATLIQGRLTDAKLSALPNVTMHLVDSKGKDLGVAAVTTDKSGYYAFVITPEQAKKIEAGTAITVAVGDAKTGFVPETAPSVSFTPGAQLTAEVSLKTADLQKVVGKINLTSVVRPSAADAAKAAATPTKKAAKTTRTAQDETPNGDT